MFVLIDLYTQIQFLPEEMKKWSRPQILEWLNYFGEIHWFNDPEHPAYGHYYATMEMPNIGDYYYFRSWCGIETVFVLTLDIQFFIPGTSLSAWQK